MANGYLRIKKADIYENNGVTYWKNGANIIGNVVKCVDSDETEHYYIESLKTKKAILLDDDVKIGGGDFGFESTNGNFILVTTDEVDFSDIGGGNGVSITFTFGNRYYTVTLPEDNGDLKIYDPDGEGGEIGGDPFPDTTDASAGDALLLDENKIPVWAEIPTPTITKKYLHHIRYTTDSNDLTITFDFVSEQSTAFNESNIRTALWNKYGNVEIPCSGSIYQNGNYGEVYSFKFTSATSDPTYYYLGFKTSDMSRIKTSGSVFGYTLYTVRDVIEEL